MSRKDDKKNKKPPAILFTGPAGAGKAEVIKQFAKLFDDAAKNNNRGIFIAGEPGSARDYLRDYRRGKMLLECINRRGPVIEFEPLSTEGKISLVGTLVRSGIFSLSKGVSMAKVTAEMQKPENKEMSPREILSLLTEKGLLKKSKNKPSKGPKPR